MTDSQPHPVAVAAVAVADGALVGSGYRSMAATGARALVDPGANRIANSAACNQSFHQLHVTQAEMSDFLAAATVLHLEDGFSYLSRASSALVMYDHGAATHLAYYAELRAGMALLASQGILSFKRRVYALGQAGWTSTGKLGTHDAVWDLINAWSKTPPALQLMKEELKAFDVRFGSWLDQVARVCSMSPTLTASGWLTRVAIDLQTARDDRAARNRFSYQPKALVPIPPGKPQQFVHECWSLLEPAGRGEFAKLDALLLRMVLVSAHRETSAGTPLADAVADIIAGLTRQSEVPERNAHDFLMGVATPLEGAVTTVAPDARGVIGRALILLRIAAAAVRMGLRTEGIADRDLDAWASGLARERGFPEVGPDWRDLWADVDFALEEVAEADFAHERPQRAFEDFERVALWTIAA